MEREEVKELMAKGLFMDKPVLGELEETNISWVILSGTHAFKIKKPLKLSFLDYSSLTLRKKHCEKEVELNRRFSPIYLNVFPIRRNGNEWEIGGYAGELVDYAVVMKRLMSGKRMDILLSKDKVTESEISVLAGQLALFHHASVKVKRAFELGSAQELFNDLTSIQEIAGKELDEKYGEWIPDLVAWSDTFLAKNEERFRQRIEKGFMRDVHGDLHSGNIFLYKKPILFDCIEFSDEYRQIDILYEIAFLYMDLEFFGKPDLARKLLKVYESVFPCFPEEVDREIFTYFKCLRANVRAKVHLLNVQSATNTKSKSLHLSKGEGYLRLAKKYRDLI